MQFKARNSGWCLPIAPTQLVDVEDMSPTTKKTAMIALLMMSAAMGEKLWKKLSSCEEMIFIFFTVSVSVQVFIYFTQKKQSTIL